MEVPSPGELKVAPKNPQPVALELMKVELAPCPRMATWPPPGLGNMTQVPLSVKVPAPSTTTLPVGLELAQFVTAVWILDMFPLYGEIVVHTRQFVSGRVPEIPACPQSIPRFESIIPDQICAWATAGSIKNIITKSRMHRLDFILTKLRPCFW
jgi:hypothetical protein